MWAATNDLNFPAVDLPSSALSSPAAAVGFLVAQLAQSGMLSPEHAESVSRQLLHRESLGSTANGRGFAVTHSKSDAIARVLGIVGRATQPLVWPWAGNSVPVHLICLLLTPKSEPGAAMRTFQAVVRQLHEKRPLSRSDKFWGDIS
jgi:mannitol/fructose-specific phosphotransferase system IIA component (Ntr-type)